jgi:hypothetical protein
VGLNYEYFDLGKISAVVQGTYHTQSVCVEKSEKQNQITKYSILTFANRCKENGVDLFLTPCDKNAYFYESTKFALKQWLTTVRSLHPRC